MTTTATPRIYAASLSDYTAGRLHGQWIDLDETTTAADIQEAIDAMLDTSPAVLAEEWAIHDYDEMPNLGEYPDLETVAEVARGIAEYGDAYRAWCENQNEQTTDPDDFRNQYLGAYDNATDYAYQVADDMGLVDKLSELGFATGYINWEAYARDLFMDLDSAHAPGGGIYVFDPNA